MRGKFIRENPQEFQHQISSQLRPGSSFSWYENEDRVLGLWSSFSRVLVFVTPNIQARVHLVMVTPKIFGVGFKILRRTGVRSTRCRRTEASGKGNTWRKWRTLTNLA